MPSQLSGILKRDPAPSWTTSLHGTDIPGGHEFISPLAITLAGNWKINIKIMGKSLNGMAPWDWECVLSIQRF